MTLRLFLIMICTTVSIQGLSAEETKLKTPESTPGILDISLMNEANAALRRGLDWLSSQQKEDGSWTNSDFPALTALALWPFLLSDHPDRDRVIDRAIAFLKSNVRDDGGIYRDIKGVKGGGLSNYNTAICMAVMHAAGKPDLVKVVQDARKYIAGSQHFGGDEYKGGFGYDKDTDRAYTDLLNTYYAVEAMKATESVEDLRPAGEKRVDINWAETVRFIERLQNSADAGHTEAGGFVYNPSDPKAGASTNTEGKVVFRSYGSITYAGMLALVYADVSRDDVRIISAMNWAANHWTLDENPGMGHQGLFFFYNIIGKCMNALNRETLLSSDGKVIKWREELASRIISLQKTDPETGFGYWINENNRFWESDPVLVTAYSLLALELAAGQTFIRTD